MTRTYVAKRLLEHGPLTFREMADITGWPTRTLEAALRCLIETGLVVRQRAGRHLNRYCLESV